MRQPASLWRVVALSLLVSITPSVMTFGTEDQTGQGADPHASVVIPPAPPAPARRPVTVEESKSFPRRFEHEADKAPIFQRYANSATHLRFPNGDSVSYHGSTVDELTLCREFGEDLRAMRNIKFIEPIVRAPTMDDPKLRAHWPKCKKLEPESQVAPYDHRLPPEDFPKYYRTKEAALYVTNFHNEDPPGEDFVLYVQGVCTETPIPGKTGQLFSERLPCIAPAFEIVDPENCTLSDSLSAHDNYESTTYNETLRYGLSALIKYKGKIWTITIEDGYQLIHVFRLLPTPTSIIIGDDGEIPQKVAEGCLFAPY